MTREEALDESFLKEQDTSRNTANGYWIGTYAGDNLYANFRDGDIGANKAAAIAEVAQGNLALEDAGLKMKHMPAAQMRSALSLLKQSLERQGENPEGKEQLLFDGLFDDSAIKLAERQSAVAATHIGDLRRKVKLAEAAEKLSRDKLNVKEVSRQLGVTVRSHADVKRQLDSFRQELARWEHYDTDAELIGQINDELGGVQPKEKPAEKPKAKAEKAKAKPPKTEQPAPQKEPPNAEVQPKKEETASVQELTEEQIRNSGLRQTTIDSALGYLKGNHNATNTIAYKQVRKALTDQSKVQPKEEPKTAPAPKPEQPKPEAKKVPATREGKEKRVSDLLDKFGGKQSAEISHLSSNRVTSNAKFSYYIDHKRFGEYLDAYQDNNLSRNVPFEVTSEMPAVFQRIASVFHDLQIAPGGIRMFSSVLDKATGKKPSNYNGDRHNVSLEELRKLPESLHWPIMVLRGAWPNSLEILTMLKDDNGRSVMVALQLNEQDKHHTINRIATVFGKDRVNYFLNKLANGYGLYVNKKRANDWSQSAQVQSLGEVLLKADSFNTIIDETESASDNTQFSYHSAENTNADIDFEALSDEKAALYGEIIEATLDFGYDILKDRVFANRHDWRESMLDALGEHFARNGFSNANIKQIFDELWEKEYTTPEGARASLERFARGRRIGAQNTGFKADTIDQKMERIIESNARRAAGLPASRTRAIVASSRSGGKDTPSFAKYAKCFTYASGRSVRSVPTAHFEAVGFTSPNSLPGEIASESEKRETADSASHRNNRPEFAPYARRSASVGIYPRKHLFALLRLPEAIGGHSRIFGSGFRGGIGLFLSLVIMAVRAGDFPRVATQFRDNVLC